jgi:hypothetical protein
MVVSEGAAIFYSRWNKVATKDKMQSLRATSGSRGFVAKKLFLFWKTE